MPLLPASGYPYQPFPSESPSTQVPSAFQNITASPGAFGAQTGQALSGLGSAFEKAGDSLASIAIQRQQLFNQVAADDSANQIEDRINKIMQGDPNVPDDVGFMGKQGRAALDARPVVHQQIDQLIADTRKNLQNPQQVLRFDEHTQRVRINTFNNMGQHYDQQFNKYAAETATAKVKIATDNAATAANNGSSDADWQNIIGTGLNGIKDSMSAVGTPPEAIDAAQRAFMKKTTADRVNAIAIKDPLAAQRFAEVNKDHLGDQFDNVMTTTRARASQMQSMEDVATGGRGRNLVRGGAIDAVVQAPEQYRDMISKAAEQYNVPEELLTRMLSAENGFKSAGVSTAGARGIAQFLPATARERGVNPDDPASAIPGAAHYLADLKTQRGSWLGALTDYLGSDPRKDASYTKNGVWQHAVVLDQSITSATKSDASVNGAPEVWGDSLGVGLRRSLQSTGMVHGGDQPAAILGNITATENKTPGYFQGKPVVLASGSNGNDMETVAKTISYLQGKGAQVAVVGYGTNFPDKDKQLQQIAQATGAVYVPAGANDGIHMSPQAYQDTAQRAQTALAAKNVSAAQASPDQLIGERPLPPLEQGQSADAQIPGLQDKIKELADNLPKDDPIRFMNAVKLARSQANAAFADQQHAYRIQQEQQKKADETISNQLITRMTSNSSNYPTTDEVNSNPQLSAEAKRTMTGFIERQTKPDPLAHVSAQNQMDLFRRIHEDDTSPDKIRDEKTINDSYTGGGLTWTARGQLIGDLREAQGASNKIIENRKAELLKLVEPKIVGPAIASTKRDTWNMTSPGWGEKELKWKNTVDDKIKEYRTSPGKNPMDLFTPGKPDYVGSDDFLKPIIGSVGNQLTDPTAKATAPIPPKLDTKENIQGAYNRGDITREQAIEAARKLGILREDSGVVIPMAR